MQPVKPQMDVQLKKPAKKSIGLSKDKNCQVTICENTDSNSQVSRNLDKSCQENENIDMQSVANTDHMQLPKPAVLHKYRRLCSDKNCQSTRCYQKRSPMRPIQKYDKNCQSANMM